MLERSILCRDHERKALFYVNALERTKKMSTCVLYGQRRFGWPLMALHTQRELGPVRHAISQMVVAGTMTIFPPFVKPPSPPVETDKPQDP